MCDIDVYILQNGQEEKIMENVDRVEQTEDKELQIQNIFGERRRLHGRIFLYDSSSKKMVFEPA